jgi:phosphoribosylglycinamide formyltransferase 1
MIRLGFLSSGNGTSIESIVSKIELGELNGFEATVVLCNKPRGEAGIYTRADNLGLHIEEAEDPSVQLSILKDLNVDLVLGMGYLKRVSKEILNYFGDKIWNIHPALLPKYGGEGMWGIHVHKAVIESGDNETGATVHVMSSVYDEGKILNQIKVPVFPDESPEQLQRRILKFEYTLIETTLVLYRDGLLDDKSLFP